MKAFLILEDGHVFTGTSIGSKCEVISEIVFNTSMTGYLEVLTDPSYAGQAVVMTYPLIGNYGICSEDMESEWPWPDGYIVRELSRIPSNFRSEDTIQNFLKKHDISGYRRNRHTGAYKDFERERYDERHDYHEGICFCGRGSAAPESIYDRESGRKSHLRGKERTGERRFPGSSLLILEQRKILRALFIREAAV